MKVSLGLILSHGFPVPAPFVMSFALLQQWLETGAGNRLLPPDLQVDRCTRIWSQAFPTDVARNEICRRFLDNDDGDVLLFLDTDMTHPPDLPHRLLLHDADVVTARYVMRRPPFFSVAMRKTGDGPHQYQAIEKLVADPRGLVEIDAGGAGALMIRRRVLEEMRRRLGDDWFRYQDGPDGLRSVSEDMWFYEQARASGYQPYLDADLHCKHCAQFDLDPSYHAPYAEAFRRAQQEVPA